MTTKTFWLSFADPTKPRGQQHLGVAIVEASSAGGALTKAWEMGCNPGGEVMIDDVTDDASLAEAPRNVLLTAEQLERFGEKVRI